VPALERGLGAESRALSAGDDAGCAEGVAFGFEAIAVAEAGAAFALAVLALAAPTGVRAVAAALNVVGGVADVERSVVGATPELAADGVGAPVEVDGVMAPDGALRGVAVPVVAADGVAVSAAAAGGAVAVAVAADGGETTAAAGAMPVPRALVSDPTTLGAASAAFSLVSSRACVGTLTRTAAEWLA
jgi:hypothetical protein